MPNEKVVELLLNSPYAGAAFFIGFILLILWLGRMGFLSFSKDKIQVSSDAGSLQVVELLRAEVTRMQSALERERQQTVEAIAEERRQCEEQMRRLRDRLTVLEEMVRAAGLQSAPGAPLPPTQP